MPFEPHMVEIWGVYSPAQPAELFAICLFKQPPEEDTHQTMVGITKARCAQSTILTASQTDKN